MRVYISADIEGVTGLVSWSQCGRPDSEHPEFGFARRMMTHDVNAAIRGARAAGATEVVVKDSHGSSKNLLIDELEPGTRLISGHGAGTDGMMQGIDSSFDAALLVGYHGMAGALGGVMEHTITGGVHRVFVNGRPCGEMGLSAGVAGTYDVPLVFASSDEVGAAEARELVPGIATVAVKRGVGRYMAELRHPSDTGAEIQREAERGVRERKRIAPHRWEEPTSIRIEFNRAEEADMAAKLITSGRVDAYTVEGTYSTFAEAHRAAWNLIALSFQGLAAQR